MANPYYNFTNTFVPATKVRSDDMNQELDAVTAGFDLLPGVGDAVTRGVTYLGIESGSANTYTVTMPDTRTTYQEGDRVMFRATHTNTGSAVINIDTIGAVTAVRTDDTALESGDILQDVYYEFIYDSASAHFQMLNMPGSWMTDMDNRVDWAEEWATQLEDTLVSTAAGGDGVSDYSALHHAAKASADAASAASSEANAEAAWDSFDDRYLGSKTSDPTLDNDGDALLEGAMYWNSVSNVLRIYNGASWQDTGSSTANVTEWTATAGQTTFSGSDENGKPLTYTVGYIMVFQNGVLLDPDEYTATNGTSVVLDTGADLDDVLNMIAFGTFDVANVYTKAETDALFYDLDLSGVDPTWDGKIIPNVNRQNWYNQDQYIANMDGGRWRVRTNNDSSGNMIGLALENVGADLKWLVGWQPNVDLFKIRADDAGLDMVTIAEDAETLALADESITYGGAPLVTMQRNLMINGGCDVWQLGVSQVPVLAGSMCADMFKYSGITTGVQSLAQLAVVDTVLTDEVEHAMQFQVTTADTVVSGTDHAHVYHTIEGRDFQGMKWGTSAAKDITLSFWTAHTLTGTYCVAFRNGSSNRSYVAEYSQAVANSWERHVVTVPGDTTGTWATDHTAGLRISFTQMSGGTYDAAAKDTWYGANYIATSNQVNHLSSATSRFFRLSGCKLEKGSVSTPYESPYFTDELARCQRYWESSYGYGVLPGTVTNVGMVRFYICCGLNSAARTVVNTVRFCVPKRIGGDSYNTVYSNNSGTAGYWYDYLATAGDKAAVINNSSHTSFNSYANQGTAKTAIDFQYHWVNDSTL